MRRLLGLLGSARSRSSVVILVASAGVGGACGGTNAADITGGDPPARRDRRGAHGRWAHGGGWRQPRRERECRLERHRQRRRRWRQRRRGARRALSRRRRRWRDDVRGRLQRRRRDELPRETARFAATRRTTTATRKQTRAAAASAPTCSSPRATTPIRGRRRSRSRPSPRASAIGGTQTVFVAAGTYNESVDLSEGISLHGGYACALASCPWTRDTKVNLTTIQSQRPEGIVANQTITSATALDGFDVRGEDQGGGGTAESRGITCAGGPRFAATRSPAAASPQGPPTVPAASSSSPRRTIRRPAW